MLILTIDTLLQQHIRDYYYI